MLGDTSAKLIVGNVQPPSEIWPKQGQEQGDPNATLASRTMHLTYGVMEQATDTSLAIVRRFPYRNYPGNAKIRNHKRLLEVF